jgi:hypothetical protein
MSDASLRRPRAVTAGGRAFALYVIPGLLLMLAAAWAGVLVA